MRFNLSNRKIMGSIIFSIIFFGVVFIVLNRHHHSDNSTEEAIIVDAEKVKQGHIAIQSKSIGTLVAANDVQIAPEIPGTVAKIFVKDGTYVSKDTPLIQLDDTSYRAKLGSDKANLLYSETDYKRKALLGKQGAISRQMIDAALADMKTKQADVEQSQVNVNKMLLVAPFDGVLGKILVSPGDYVASGQKVVSLTDIAHLRVEYSVSEKYLPQIKLGQIVKVTTSAYPNKEFTGTVAYISPTINKEDRTISLYAEIPNESRALTAGLFVNVTQALGAENNAILIPAASLVPTIEGQKVFKVVNNKAIEVPVNIGQRTNNIVEIISGLTKEDTIVTAGQEKLKEGALVSINATHTKG